MHTRFIRWIKLLLFILFVTAIPWQSVSAHEAPPGSEWVMADWMFLTFVLFAGVSFTIFIIVLKAGLLSNLEDAKYYIVDQIQEEDFYHSDWEDATQPGGDK